ncbi:hypothetical protein P8935_18990 [Telmatobacter sp. DSM 110680]|uniref:WD40-like Beta Propeller Repeat n=1 Tax=Telmatobacter sp. DSM 110680 TaxID=3036704 RepID=A0AAU7DG71_9BACT
MSSQARLSKSKGIFDPVWLIMAGMEPLNMRAFKVILVSLTVAGSLGAGIFLIASQRTSDRIQRKAAQAEAEVKDVAMHGGDVSAILAMLAQVRPALDSGDARRAEGLLDRALNLLAQDRSKPHGADVSSLPVFQSQEKECRLYVDPQLVVIAGYDGSAMEPFISPDGQFLFFNNENDPNVNTNLHFARRTGTNHFQYLGEIPGVNSPSLDAVPSMDAAGNFYFTTLREYDRTMNSIYAGHFDGREVRDVHPVAGNISPTLPLNVNMDASISPDGQTLYISRAVIVPGASAPKKSELMVARIDGGAFAVVPDSAEIMKNINTGPLAYAPAISANGLELYFTRASQSEPGATGIGAKVRIVVARRSSLSDPFGEPQVLGTLKGFVEAPSLSLDGSELFFHKKVGDKYLIYRAVRSSN